MLQGTPSLMHFSIGFKSTSGLPRRTVGVKDLFQNIPDSANMEGAQGDDEDYANDSLGLQSECTQLPLLKRLDLKGSWALETQVLETLCRMAPSVTGLWLLGCNGFSLVDWVRITSTRLQSLDYSGASGSLSAALSTSAGLVNMNFSVGEGDAVWYQYGQLPEVRITDHKLIYYVYP